MASVLLVDDDSMSLALQALLIERFGVKVYTASNGFEALKYFVKQGPCIVITDDQMPEIDGFMLCRLLKVISPTVPLAIISSQNCADKASELGAVFIKRPYVLPEFKAKILDLLGEPCPI